MDGESVATHAMAMAEDDEIALASACPDDEVDEMPDIPNQQGEVATIPCLGLRKALKHLNCAPPSHGCPSAPPVSTHLFGKVSGHRPLSVSGRACIQCWACAVKPNEPLDHDYLKLQKCFVANGASFHNRSMVVRAEELGLSRSTLETKILRLASAYNVFCRSEWALFQQCLRNSLSAPSLVLFVEYMAYDETPMKTKVADPLVLQIPCSSDGGARSASPEFPNSPRLQQTLSVTNASPSTKILQVQHACAVVVRIGARYVSVFGDVPCHLQVLEKNNAVVLAECLRRLSAVTSSSDAFNLQSRVVSRDQAGANKKAERGIQHERHGKWAALELDCEIHATARAFNKTYDQLLSDDVSGLLNVALCLRSGANMTLFRRCLQQECLSTLKIYFAPIPAEAQEYRRHILQTFVSTGSNRLLNRVLLSKLPNGLWSKTSVVEVYMPPHMGGHVNQDRLAAMLTMSLCYVLTGSKPHLFARHRWTGCDLAVEELARLEGIHGLLSRTWSRFVSNLSTTSNKASSGLGGPASEVRYDGDIEEIPDAEGRTLRANTEGDIGDSSASLDVVVSSGDAEKNRTPEQHAQDRKKASLWLDKKPFSTLVLMKVSMTPLVALLNSQLCLSSMEWDKQQRTAQAQAWASGRPVPQRDYMLTLAAQNTLEDTYFGALGRLFFEESEWKLVEERKYTVSFRALAFRVLSRQGCLIHIDLRVPHRMPPFTLFRVLRSEDMAQVVASTPPCLLDEWSARILQRYPTLVGEECKEVLHTHAKLASTNTAPIESRHSSLRRQLLGRSMQTWAMSFPVLSAEFLLQGSRRHRLNFGCAGAGSTSTAGTTTSSHAASSSKRQADGQAKLEATKAQALGTIPMQKAPIAFSKCNGRHHTFGPLLQTPPTHHLAL